MCLFCQTVKVSVFRLLLHSLKHVRCKRCSCFRNMSFKVFDVSAYVAHTLNPYCAPRKRNHAGLNPRIRGPLHQTKSPPVRLHLIQPFGGRSFTSRCARGALWRREGAPCWWKKLPQFLYQTRYMSWYFLLVIPKCTFLKVLTSFVSTLYIRIFSLTMVNGKLRSLGCDAVQFGTEIRMFRTNDVIHPTTLSI